jgi:integrase
VKRRKSKVVRKSWPRIYQVLKNGKKAFMVDSRRTGFNGRRAFYVDEAQALVEADSIARDKQNHGAMAFMELSVEQRKDAGEAIGILSEFNKSLVDSARYYAAYLRAKRENESARNVADCINEYLEAKRADQKRGGISKLTLYELESKMRIVREAFAGKKITEVDDRAVEAFIKSLPHNPRGKANIRTKLSQLLNFCRRQKWISVNPAAEVKVPVKRHRIEILGVAQVETLLGAAQRFERAQSVVPYLLVSLFAGLRPGEAEQLTWEKIHFETQQIEVLGITSKTREDRFVYMEPALIEWLLPYRKAGGLIVGSNFTKDFKEVKKCAGFGTNENATCRWPKDVLRHTYASYWLPIHKDRAHLAELMGNSLAVIKSHYKRAIPETVAEKFWALRPLAEHAQPIKFQAA